MNSFSRRTLPVAAVRIAAQDLGRAIGVGKGEGHSNLCNGSRLAQPHLQLTLLLQGLLATVRLIVAIVNDRPKRVSM